ncbi:MAG: hypothetical protein KBS98_00890 [Flavobacterium sp.]|nr:hypothetical protein [Candidatus Neoflavobacterium equi]
MNTKVSDDLAHIRSMMERSSRFISLSGLSGVVAGVIALLGAAIGYYLLSQSPSYDTDIANPTPQVVKYFSLAVGILISALGSGFVITRNKSKRLGLPLYTATTKKMLWSLAVPLLCGGIFSLALIYHENFAYIAPVMLIFYGLALCSVEKYTFEDVKYLGLLELTLGFCNLFLLGYGLLFWTIGFGILHILYGLILYKKYN